MWLPAEPVPEDLSGLPLWRPGEFALEGLSYIVVDELHEGIAGLVVSPWPRVDAHGRLRFADEAASRRVATPAAALEHKLRTREPIAPGLNAAQRAALRERPVAIGDVFAAREDLAPPIYDVTGPAREQAKTQTSAALSGAVDASYLEVVAEEMADAGD